MKPHPLAPKSQPHPLAPSPKIGEGGQTPPSCPSPNSGRGFRGEVRKRTPRWASLLAIVCVCLIAAYPTLAQIAVTADDVNRVAKQLYCPVCPNETLDACQTQACVQWREEIHTQLTEGQTAQQVIDSFARRYGERVLATPQDPALRALSVYTPFILAGIALVIAVLTFTRWQRANTSEPHPPTPSPKGETDTRNDSYRSILERDLRE